jgi:L-lactate dehydrogenase
MELDQVCGIDERKITIVGTGQVGATCAYTLMNSGLVNSMVLIDANRDLAEGHAPDLRHGMSFSQPCKIKVGSFEDCRDSDIVIVAGVGQKPGESRLDLVKKNAAIFKDIIPRIAGQNPRIILIVTNPVDILSYVAYKVSAYPMNRVFGSGTMLDTARFRSLLGEYCGVDPRNVHGYILGEHGDSEVPIWSQVMIGGVDFKTFCETYKSDYNDLDRDTIFSKVKNAAYEIINKKGATYYAIALAVTQLVHSILRDENSILTVSTLLNDYYGIEDTYMSVPSVIHRNGIERIIRITLNDREKNAIIHSAGVLKSVMKEIGI